MKIAVIAPGAMGAAVAWRLHRNNATVAITLQGRGPATATRAQGLPTLPSETALAGWADIVLSILPPGEALALAERIAPHLAGKIFADCNAVSPETVHRIAAAVPGAQFADIGIIGGPPKADGPGPKLYASGPAAPALAFLSAHGIDLRPIEGGTGAASALKMGYGGITKGITAIASAMAIGATQAGVAEALLAELADSQPDLLRLFRRAIPDMLPKAYRWVAEMQEISSFLGRQPAAPTYQGIAALYQSIADDQTTPSPTGPTAALTQFFRKPGDPS